MSEARMLLTFCSMDRPLDVLLLIDSVSPWSSLVAFVLDLVLLILVS